MNFESVVREKDLIIVINKLLAIGFFQVIFFIVDQLVNAECLVLKNELEVFRVRWILTHLIAKSLWQSCFWCFSIRLELVNDNLFSQDRWLPVNDHLPNQLDQELRSYLP
jgi:hypothetical protein